MMRYYGRGDIRVRVSNDGTLLLVDKLNEPLGLLAIHVHDVDDLIQALNDAKGGQNEVFDVQQSG